MYCMSTLCQTLPLSLENIFEICTKYSIPWNLCSNFMMSAINHTCKINTFLKSYPVITETDKQKKQHLSSGPTRFLYIRAHQVLVNTILTLLTHKITARRKREWPPITSPTHSIPLYFRRIECNINGTV